MTTDAPLRLALASLYLPSASKIGAGYMSHRLANALADLGHEVTMFSPSGRCSDARYEHRTVELTGRARTFKWGWELRRQDLSGFDALLAQGDDHFVRRGAVPVHIRTMLGSCFDEARFVHGAKERLRMVLLGLTELVSAVRTPKVVGISACSLRYFPWLHDVIPCGVDTALFHADQATKKEERPTIIFVGTYERRKRGWLLRKVFDEVILPALPDAQLWMVCSDAPPGDGVTVLGRVSDEELADLYRRAWVMCLPSTYEGFGVPYIEAMLSGTAVVATPNLGATEVLERGTLGILAPDEQLGVAVLRQLTDHAAREAFIARGLDRRTQYDFATIAQTYVDLVRRGLRTGKA